MIECDNLAIMKQKIEPIYAIFDGRKVCVNAREVIENIRQCQKITYSDLARRAGVQVQSIFRWSKLNKSKANPMKRLWASFESSKEDISSVLLVDASPAQLRSACQRIGWGRVINAEMIKEENGDRH